MSSLRYFQRMMSGRATDWNDVVAMASAMPWPRSSRPAGKRPRSSIPETGAECNWTTPGRSWVAGHITHMPNVFAKWRSTRRSFSTPFCMQTTGVDGGATVSCVSACSVCCPFTASSTTVSSAACSSHATSAGSETAAIGRVTVSSGASRTKPDRRARPCSPRATRVTSKPFW